jgi:type II secretory pathway component PulF
VRLRQQKLFFDLVARGLRSGLGIVEICRGLAASPGPLATVASHVGAAVEGGRPLSDAIQKHTDGVNLLVLNLVRIGEQSGRLEEACVSAGNHIEEMLTLRRALLSPLAYPMVMLLLSFFLLPVPTLVLKGSGAYAIEVFVAIGWAALVFAPLAALILYGSRSRAVLEAILRAPVGRDVHRYLVTENLYAVLRTGYPIRQGFDLLSQGYESDIWRERFTVASDRLNAGEPFADTVAALRLYDAEALMTIRAGEQSGSLDEVFEDLCKRYREVTARRLALAARVITGLLGLAIMASLAFRILGAFQGVLGGNEELMREIERATPFKPIP